MTQQKENMIITGASGFIGTALIRQFKDRFRIFALDVQKPNEDVLREVEFFELDLTSDKKVNIVLQQIKARVNVIHSVIHTAAYYEFSDQDDPLYQEVTIDGTRRLLRALQDVTVEQFVFTSTLLVHEPCALGQTIDEESPLDPKWPYPESKVKTESAIRQDCGSIPVVILRIAGVYDHSCHSIPISHQIRRVYHKKMKSHVYPGNEDHGQPYVHRDDLMNAIQRVVECRQALSPLEVFLIAEPDTFSYQEIQDALGELIHGKEAWKTLRVPKPMAKAGAWIDSKNPLTPEPFIKPWMVDMADDHMEADISHACEKLGWKPHHRLKDTLPYMIDHLKRDESHWLAMHGLDQK